MQPIVLVGGGENHYRLIQSLSEEKRKNRSVILVTQNHKVLPKRFLPSILAGVTSFRDCQLDLWSACHRKGVYLLEDECLNLNREENLVNLKNFGNLNFTRLSIETEAAPTLTVQGERENSLFLLQNSEDFLQQVRHFFSEVHRHCPREVRVVISGLSRETVELAFAIQNNLENSCELCDIVILEDKKINKQTLLKNHFDHLVRELKAGGIRVVENVVITEKKPQFLRLNNGMEISYDVMIPMAGWRSHDFLGKLLQTDQNKIFVRRDLSDVRDPNVFVTGYNVQFENEERDVFQLDETEVSQALLHNLFKVEDSELNILCRDRLAMQKNSVYSTSAMSRLFRAKDKSEKLKVWKQDIHKELSQLKQVEVQEGPLADLKDTLAYQARHMSRPWKRLVHSSLEGPSTIYRLNSFNGFNSWGSYTQSAIKICEIAILKGLANGVKPRQLRFNLTLPDSVDHLTSHIFESTFRAIEGVALKHQIEIDGGDTFDGQHWHLNITVGGEIYRPIQQRLNPHDYLIMTRPLGFGFLWAGRLQDQFDSSWIHRTIKETTLINFEKYCSFVERWNPSAQILIEEWGFLYHCLQMLPANQQLMINFREVPRWEGIDQLINGKVSHPGLDTNWSRISSDVAFAKDDISMTNSVLWDSLSQGTLVFGVKPEKWREARQDLRDLGYKRAALVGCTRPKAKGNRVVLSDWTPA